MKISNKFGKDSWCKCSKKSHRIESGTQGRKNKILKKAYRLDKHIKKMSGGQKSALQNKTSLDGISVVGQDRADVDMHHLQALNKHNLLLHTMFQEPDLAPTKIGKLYF